MKSKYLMLFLKGCAMGTADVVPGVSGGTIAFISGIYEELIDAIHRFDASVVKMLLKGEWKKAWHHVHASFLLPIFLGVGLAIFSLAKLMSFLLTNYPIQIWAYFFGLIIASAFLVSGQISKWNPRVVGSMLVGIIVAWAITEATPAQTPDEWWFVMLSGAIAICAMILPGISGAFILLLLGKYQYIIGAVGELNIPVLAIFAVGAVVGLISFSHLLSWLLKHYHDLTVALLMGFMLGSLNKVWPWKVLLPDMDAVAGVEENVLPQQFATITHGDSFLLQAVLLCIVGLLSIYLIELAARILLKKREAK